MRLRLRSSRRWATRRLPRASWRPMENIMTPLEQLQAYAQSLGRYMLLGGLHPVNPFTAKRLPDGWWEVKGTFEQVRQQVLPFDPPVEE